MKFIFLLLSILLFYSANLLGGDEFYSTSDIFKEISKAEKNYDFKKALELLISITEKNPDFIIAKFQIANYYFYGRKNIKQEQAKARLQFAEVINLLHKTDMTDAKLEYIMGICVGNVSGDMPQAMEWLLKAAKQGYAPAQAEVAFRYMKGIGTKSDFAKAYNLAKEASEAGDMFGKAILGAYFLNVSKNEKQGIKLIKESADSGNAGGQYMLFRCLYYKTPGIEKDEKLGLRLLKLSADQGFSDAVSKLRIFEHHNKLSEISDIQKK